jgi:outer membrane receptor protein involved in Fe transport
VGAASWVGATWTGSLDAGRGWTAGWGIRWRDPRDGGSWTTVDLRVGRRFLDQLTVSLEASNLFDREITELHGVPLPGRWVTVTVGWRQP